jgi:hypothetical protein
MNKHKYSCSSGKYSGIFFGSLRHMVVYYEEVACRGIQYASISDTCITLVRYLSE